MDLLDGIVLVNGHKMEESYIQGKKTQRSENYYNIS